jgi:hypothetical protein
LISWRSIARLPQGLGAVAGNGSRSPGTLLRRVRSLADPKPCGCETQGSIIHHGSKRYCFLLSLRHRCSAHALGHLQVLAGGACALSCEGGPTVSRYSAPTVAGCEPAGCLSFNDPAAKPDADAAAFGSAHGTGLKEIPAAVFAALVGRTLRTLRNWDEAGLTHPEMRNSRRYYGATDLAAVVASSLGRRGPREGSAIRYLSVGRDKGP